jgi:hypothetical protein
MTMKNFALLTGTILALTALSGCNEEGSPGDDGNTGTLHANLTLGEGKAHDVAQAHYVVVPAGGSCTDVPIAEATGTIEEEALQGNLDPTGTETGRAFVDGLMVLPPGDYKVCVQPLQADGKPSTECEAVSADVTVTSEVTTEIVLISQCQGVANGGLDVVVGLNDPPVINDLDIGPSKFITTCQTAELTVDASDPNGDELSYDWSIVSGPAGGVLDENGATATFTPGAAGDYELLVTVYDSTGGSTKLSFPVHVSQADQACNTPACPAGTYDAAGYCWVVAQDFEYGSESCGRFGLTGADTDVANVKWTQAMMADVSTKLGCTNEGQRSCCAPSLYFDSATNECFTTGFSDTAENQDYQNATFAFSDTALAVHLCNHPQ